MAVAGAPNDESERPGLRPRNHPGHPVRRRTQVEGIEYCKGWGDHANMGVSVLVAYDYAEDRYRVFTGGDLDGFAALCADRYPLVGFNNIDFDNRVLAVPGIVIEPGRCYDILAEIWRSLGKRTKGYRLDDCARANLGAAKSGNGALAPVWWQQGKIGAVVDYCMQDVLLTKRLFDRIVETGAITDPVTGRPLPLRRPVLHAESAVVGV